MMQVAKIHTKYFILKQCLRESTFYYFICNDLAIDVDMDKHSNNHTTAKHTQR
jgi:hypothetical protein